MHRTHKSNQLKRGDIHRLTKSLYSTINHGTDYGLDSPVFHNKNNTIQNRPQFYTLNIDKKTFYITLYDYKATVSAIKAVIKNHILLPPPTLYLSIKALEKEYNYYLIALLYLNQNLIKPVENHETIILIIRDMTRLHKYKDAVSLYNAAIFNKNSTDFQKLNLCATLITSLINQKEFNYAYSFVDYLFTVAHNIYSSSQKHKSTSNIIFGVINSFVRAHSLHFAKKIIDSFELNFPKHVHNKLYSLYIHSLFSLQPRYAYLYYNQLLDKGIEQNNHMLSIILHHLKKNSDIKPLSIFFDFLSGCSIGFTPILIGSVFDALIEIDCDGFVNDYYSLVKKNNLIYASQLLNNSPHKSKTEKVKSLLDKLFYENRISTDDSGLDNNTRKSDSPGFYFNKGISKDSQPSKQNITGISSFTDPAKISEENRNLTYQTRFRSSYSDNEIRSALEGIKKNSASIIDSTIKESPFILALNTDIISLFFKSASRNKNISLVKSIWDDSLKLASLTKEFKLTKHFFISYSKALYNCDLLDQHIDDIVETMSKFDIFTDYKTRKAIKRYLIFESKSKVETLYKNFF
ncbi:hypothetical protein AYI70_g2891 [Smittium culicis]|uniref:Uncharacterized protein n=1 Tax=Smittium culicis TaxID=133412 RepID=A0A1R1XJY0_9FUNG|nr:hypothetical protein AYI70_g7581 [Smittium culicis]OMJ22418.1 hypothetical protein AYI70_g2891 [Smittium culicis]